MEQLTKRQQQNREHYAKNAEKIKEQKRKQYQSKRTAKLAAVIGAEIKESKQPKTAAVKLVPTQERQQSARERLENRLADRQLQRELNSFI